ncbi:MAG: DEAD/DEAH box helicase [Candidatus Helarchaeota archaeon]
MSEVKGKIKIILESNGISHLRPIQEMSLPYILENERQNLLVVAPSASGKTLIGEIALLNVILSGMKGFFLVPLKAIANEKFKSFYRKYGSLNIKIAVSTGDFDISLDEIERNNLIITTYERFDSIIRKKPQWIKQIGVVVIDEIHNLGDYTRGIRLESLITRLLTYKHIQVIGLSATIKNPEELASWLKAKLIKSNQRPCELRYKIIETEDKLSTLKELIPNLVKTKAQTLIFTRTRKEAENLARKLSKIIKALLLPDEINALETYSKSILDSMLDFDIISSGVGYHHAGLDHNSRILIERLFNDYLLKIICCTTTLASGINTPAKVVIIKDIRYYKENTNTIDYISRNKFHQIAGRAGRFSKGTGFAIILVSNKEEAEKIRNYYFKPSSINNGKSTMPVFKSKYENIRSMLSEYKDLLINQTLVFINHSNNGLKRKDIIKFFKKTFYYHQLSDNENNDELVERFAFDSKNVKAILGSNLPELTQIPNAKVVLTKFSENIIEGIVTLDCENVNYSCNFSNNSKYCTCPSFKTTGICYHLYHLGSYALDVNQILAKDTILRSLKEHFILDYLLDNMFIYIEDGRFKCTELGKLIVDLFLNTRMFLLIKNRLRFISTTYDFLDLIIILAEMKFNKSLSYHYLAVLNEIIKSNKDVNIIEILKSMITNDIGLGDLENFIDTARWITNAIIKVAEKTIEGNNNILSIGKMILNKITRPLPDEEVMSNIIQYSISSSNLNKSSFNEDEILELFAEKIQCLLILHKNSGVTLYSYNFSDKTIDPALISGYISAINSFGIELSGSSHVNMRKMEYDRFKIILQEGEYIRIGLIISDIQEDWLMKKIEHFVITIEDHFKHQLSEWNGNINVFKSIGILFNEIFGINIIKVN